MPLYIREHEVERLLPWPDALEVVEACFDRLGRGLVDNRPRFRIPAGDTMQHTLAAADPELGVCGLKSYVGSRDDGVFVVLLFGIAPPALLAVLEADVLGRRRTAAASAVAARHLAAPGARTLGVIGTGWQAEAQVEAIRAGLPAIETVVAYSRDPARLAAFCERTGAAPGEYNRDAAEQDVVVTATGSRDPVLRGEWLRPGALVCAIGANRIERRELDNAVLERATFVCCDSREQARIEAGDLVEPVEQGVLDWLEVHELGEVVCGAVCGRQADDDIVLFKSVGIAAEDLAVAKLVYERARSDGAGIVLDAGG